jgi:3-methyladenine DNA glycosylase AlkD
MKRACELILGSSQDPASGGFSQKRARRASGGVPSGVIPCLTGNMVWSLLRLGYGRDQRVWRGVEWLTRHLRFDDGDSRAPDEWPYRGWEMCYGRHACLMGVVKGLKALAAIPMAQRTAAVETTIAAAMEFLLVHRVYKRSHDPDRVAKPGWTRFGFPRMYQTDVLETAELLVDLGCTDSRLDDALELIESRRQADGRWLLQDTFNGKFQVDIEHKGKPSKWITLRALRVLARSPAGADAVGEPRPAQPGRKRAGRRGAHPRLASIIEQIRALGSDKRRQGMARCGINVDSAFGVSVPELRKIAKPLASDHRLALALWATGNHEARLLACFVDDPAAVTEEQVEAWAADFDSWDICDQATTSLFDQTPHGWLKAVEWAARDEPWIKRGAFALMAGLAVHDKASPDKDFKRLLPLIQRGAFDERKYVNKAVSWALRNIGKRNRPLNAAAVARAEKIRAAANRRAGSERGGDPAARAARWVAADALRELTSDKIQARLAR